MEKKRALVWLRRDLRLHDHGAIAHASSLARELAFVFIFDPEILGSLPSGDRRLSFIHRSLEEIDRKLREKGSLLLVRHGDPRREIPKLAKALGAARVVAGRDYETSAKARDQAVGRELKAGGAILDLVKDQVIFEGLEVTTQSGGAFKVFTPYSRAWKAKLKSRDWEKREYHGFRPVAAADLKNLCQEWSLEKIGFRPVPLWLEPGTQGALQRLRKFSGRMKDYRKNRDIPSVAGTSGLSVHLRFGTLSIRECVREALSQTNAGAETWLNELIWRDFYQMILDQFPHVEKHAFKKEYDGIQWPGKSPHFQAWCEGRTGYPIVDAAMRHFNETGWMHNRLRMVAASFLVKDLLIHWKQGEEYFARNLLDFDLSANNGGWQWCASTGCDAQPYFRIFNPYSQSEKFDPGGDFIRAQLPELKNVKGKAIHRPETGGLFGASYPEPVVDHSAQREKAIRLFKK